MVREKYAVRTPEERENLQRLVRGGKSPARMTTRARILLKTGDGWPAPQVAEALDVAKGTVYRIKRRFVEDGLEGALWERTQAHRYRKLDDRGEAHLVALACSPAPEGHDHWTLRLLAGKSWGWRPPCPTKGCASGSKKRSQLFPPRGPKQPPPRHLGSGGRPQPVEPQAGWRHVAVTQRRTMEDFAQQMRWLVDEAYPEVEVVRVVLDNLNTHRMASLYEAFPAAEARRIAKRLGSSRAGGPGPGCGAPPSTGFQT